MPNPLDGLKAQGYPTPPKPPMPNIQNVGSGGKDPAIDRAVAALQGEYPTDLRGVDVQPMNWRDPLAGSTVTGITYTDRPLDAQSIELNPALTSAFPQSTVNNTLAHELQHVRQNRAAGSQENAIAQHLKELDAPYNKRPSEEEAFAVGSDYRHHHDGPFNTYPMDPGTDVTFGNQGILDALPLHLSPAERLARAFRGIGLNSRVE